MAFDPCREWLGIAAVDLADPCRVLGLGWGRHRAEAIEQAAANRLATLGRVTPGPFAKAHAALVSRVEAARDELLANALPSAPPPSAEEEPAAPPAAVLVDHWAGAAEPTEPGAELPAGNEVPPVEDGLGEQASASPFGIRTRRRSFDRPHHHGGSGGGVLLASVGLLVFAIALLAYLVLRPQMPPASEVAVVPPTTPRVVVDPKPADPPPQPTDEGRNRKRPRPKPRDEDDQPQSVVPEPVPQSADVSADEQDQKKLEAERARLAAAFDKAIREVYAALKDHQFAVADRALERADQQVGDDVENARRLERWRLLATYARQFVGFRGQAFAAANAGREFETGGVRFAIIEINPQLFIYKQEGQIMRVPRDSVDPAIEMAVVQTWFDRDGRAANHLFLGAGWLCRERPDLRRARSAWQTAGNGGENAAPLLALLDDPAVRQPGR